MTIGGRGHERTLWPECNTYHVHKVRDEFTDTSPVQSIKEIGYGLQQFMSLGEYTTYDGRYDSLCIKVEGFFRPPYSGMFRIMIEADDQGEFYISESGNNKTDLVIEIYQYYYVASVAN